ncbi:MAG: hypothetical protein SNJ69_13265 [Chloroflexaceae bacterium]
MLVHSVRLTLVAMAALFSLAPAVLLAGDRVGPERRADHWGLLFAAAAGRPSRPLAPVPGSAAPLGQAPPDRAEETSSRGSRAIFFAFLCLSSIPILSLAVAFALKRRFDTLSRTRRSSGKYRSPDMR